MIAYYLCFVLMVCRVLANVSPQDEDELDSHTMVKTNSESAGTMRATSTMSEGAQTMIEHNSTMLESDLGTMVINSDDDEEEDGTMKRMLLICFLLITCFLVLHDNVVS